METYEIDIDGIISDFRTVAYEMKQIFKEFDAVLDDVDVDEIFDESDIDSEMFEICDAIYSDMLDLQYKYLIGADAKIEAILGRLSELERTGRYPSVRKF